MKEWLLVTEQRATSLLEETVSVRQHWHNVDNNCPPAASASPASLHSMYDMHVLFYLVSLWHSKICLGSYGVKKYERYIVASELLNVKGKKDGETAVKLAEKMLTRQKRIAGLPLFFRETLRVFKYSEFRCAEHNVLQLRTLSHVCRVAIIQ